MSPQAGHLLLNEVLPRIISASSHCVHFVGCEDHQEVAQDAVAMAAKILHNAEAAGKQVTAGNVTYYALQHAKSGRRSVGSSVSDVLASGTQLLGHSKVYSFQHPLPVAEETNEEFQFQELFENAQEDPSRLAARKLDWEAFLSKQCDRSKAIIQAIAEGRTMKSVAKKLRLSLSTVLYHKNRLALAIREFMGDDVLALVVQQPGWKTNLIAMRQKHIRTPLPCCLNHF